MPHLIALLNCNWFMPEPPTVMGESCLFAPFQLTFNWIKRIYEKNIGARVSVPTILVSRTKRRLGLRSLHALTCLSTKENSSAVEMTIMKGTIMMGI
jgi:hypothetical protein